MMNSCSLLCLHLMYQAFFTHSLVDEFKPSCLFFVSLVHFYNNILTYLWFKFNISLTRWNCKNVKSYPELYSFSCTSLSKVNVCLCTSLNVCPKTIHLELLCSQRHAHSWQNISYIEYYC